MLRKTPRTGSRRKRGGYIYVSRLKIGIENIAILRSERDSVDTKIRENNLENRRNTAYDRAISEPKLLR